MNYRIIVYYVGSIFKIIGAFLLIPLVTSLFYREWNVALCFLYTGLIFEVLGFLSTFKAPKNRKVGSKEGLIVVGISWVLISIVGALPFTMAGTTNFYDAILETVSGFTTTGATIFNDVEILPKGILMWRSLTHWLGGMGILVFLLAVIPSSDGSVFQFMKFEAPGPQVGKLVSKVRHSAAISYFIYLGLTVMQMIFLFCGGMSFFEGVNIAFSTAGTGGFAVLNSSAGDYSVYNKIVITVFMLIFSINFNVYYLIVIGKISTALRNEEFVSYLIYIVVCSFAVAFSIMSALGSFGEALLESVFAVASVASTTGFTTTDYALWSETAKGILTVVYLVGACAGSTGGGLKFSRLIVTIKYAFVSLISSIRPNNVYLIKLNGKTLSRQETEGITSYFLLFVLVIVLSVILLCLFGNTFDVSFYSVLAMFNNIGPCLSSGVGATSSYASFNWASKLVMILDMLIGRLEIFPILLLFAPQSWSKRF